MSGESRSFDPTIWIPNLVALLFAAVGVVVERTPLVSLRPERPVVGKAEAIPTRVHARLWQDPLEAVATLQEQASASELKRIDAVVQSCAESVAQAWKDRGSVNRSSLARILVLPVLLDSSSYPEKREQRLRTRYAVLSALARAQYIPQQREQLNVFPFRTGPASRSLLIPYEQFELRRVIADHVRIPGHPYEWRSSDTGAHLEFKDAYDAVVVVWLDETTLSEDDGGPSTQSPLLNRVDRLLTELIPQAVRTNCSVKIIGPTESNRLEELCSPRIAFTSAYGGPVEILSARATVPQDALAIARDNRPDPEELGWSFSIPIRSKTSKWLLRRTNSPDDLLVHELLRELRRRGVSPGENPEHHLAIVAEWDSLYPRVISRKFSVVLAERQNEGSNTSVRARWQLDAQNVHEFSYLRGLDGKTAPPAGAASRNETRNTPGSTGEKSRGSESMERAEGESQFDYLRRLADQIEATNRRLKRTGGEIAAIGILGSDVYDKLLVLRALRRKFPHVLFFTTDLDALYLDANEAEWTRNVLVASSFGFTAAETFQDRIPPFRDSYQTAIFLTCLQALNLNRYRLGAEWKPYFVGESTLGVSLFEIGRGVAQPLTVSGAGELVDAPPVGISSWLSVHRAGLVGIFVLIAAAAWWLAVVIFREKPRVVSVILCFVFSVLGVTAAGFALGFWRLRPPLQFFGPIETILIVAVLICTAGFVAAQVRRRYRDIWVSACERCNLSVNWYNHRAWLVVFCSLGMASLSMTVAGVVSTPGEEPVVLFKGVSSWPSEALQLFAIVSSVAFILIGNTSLSAMRRSIGIPFSELKDRAKVVNDPPLAFPSFQGVRTKLLSFVHHPLQGFPRHRVGDDVPRRRYTQRIRDLWMRPTEASNLSRAEVDFWEEYLRVSTSYNRLARVSLYVASFLALIIVGFVLFGLPHAPVRGIWSRSLNAAISSVLILTITVLLCYVLDSVIIACQFLRRIGEYVKKDHSALTEAEAMDVISEMVGTVSRLIYYPFTAIAIVIMAHNPIFDAWEWSPSLIAVLALGFGVIVLATVLLQREARSAKINSIDFIDEQLRTAQAAVVYLARPHPSRLPMRIREENDMQTEGFYRARIPELKERRLQVEAHHGAAFQAWHRNPIFAALLIPLTGVGSIKVLEQLVRYLPSP